MYCLAPVSYQVLPLFGMENVPTYSFLGRERQALDLLCVVRIYDTTARATANFKLQRQFLKRMLNVNASHTSHPELLDYFNIMFLTRGSSRFSMTNCTNEFVEVGRGKATCHDVLNQSIRLL